MSSLMLHFTCGLDDKAVFCSSKYAYDGTKIVCIVLRKVQHIYVFTKTRLQVFYPDTSLLDEYILWWNVYELVKYGNSISNFCRKKPFCRQELDFSECFVRSSFPVTGGHTTLHCIMYVYIFIYIYFCMRVCVNVVSECISLEHYKTPNVSYS